MNFRQLLWASEKEHVGLSEWTWTSSTQRKLTHLAWYLEVLWSCLHLSIYLPIYRGHWVEAFDVLEIWSLLYRIDPRTKLFLGIFLIDWLEQTDKTIPFCISGKKFGHSISRIKTNENENKWWFSNNSKVLSRREIHSRQNPTVQELRGLGMKELKSGPRVAPWKNSKRFFVFPMCLS